MDEQETANDADDQAALGALAAAQLARTQHHQESLWPVLQSVSDFAILAMDVERRITLWNRGAEHLFGYREQDVLGELADLIFLPEDRSAGAPAREANEALLSGRADDERWHQRRDGSRFFAIGSLTVRRDASGHPCGFTKICRDATQRWRADQELKRLAEQRQLTLAAAQLGWWRLDTPSQHVIWDDQARAIFGLPSETVTLEALCACVHPEDRERVRQQFRSALAGLPGITLHERFRVVAPDGRIRRVDTLAQKWVEESARDEAVCLVGTVADVTERLRNEEIARRQEAWLHQLADTLPQIIWAARPDGQVDYYNRRWYEYTGLVPGVIGDASWEPVIPDAGLLHNVWRECIRTGRPFEFEYRIRRATDGMERWHLGRALPVRASDGTIQRWIGTNTDIHDRKMLEAENAQLLEAERRRTDQLIEIAETALAASASGKSLEEVCQMLARRARHILGAHQAIASVQRGGTWGAAVWSQDVSDKYASVASQGPDDSGLASIVCRTNRPLRLAQAEMQARLTLQQRPMGEVSSAARGWLAVPLIGRDGRNFGFIQLADKMAGGDFTPEDEAILAQLAAVTTSAIDNLQLLESERQALQAAVEARQAAEEASRMKDEFLATVSHELRTPLNAIVGWATLLQDPELEPETLSEGIEAIERNAAAQARLIEDLLDIGRITTGRLRVQLQPIDLCTVLHAAVETVQAGARAKGLVLETDCPSSLPLVLADSDRMQQVFWNLLSNAIKFTNAGGRVDVRAGADGHNVFVTIADTGRGIEPEFLPHVFERFLQADARTNRRQGGLGLGLAIVRHLVELHGGSVSAESDGLGAGSTFTVVLPVVERERGSRSILAATARPRASAPGAGELEGRRVLVLDDDADTRRVIEAVLSRAGAEVTLVGTVTDALGVLTADHAFDAVLSDIGMPGEDGYVFAHRMRTLERGWARRRLPLAAVTAFTREQDRAKAMAAGFDSFVSKPLRPTELVEIVSVMVHSRPRS